VSTIEKIRVGTLLKGAVLLDEDCKNPIWKAPIKFGDDSTEIVYLKVFDERTIFVEGYDGATQAIEEDGSNWQSNGNAWSPV